LVEFPKALWAYLALKEFQKAVEAHIVQWRLTRALWRLIMVQWRLIMALWRLLMVQRMLTTEQW
jgi:hypothetical protein